MVESIVWLIHVLAAAGVIGLVLLQHGKGADVGAAFGTGSAGSLFGSSGAANFLSRMTAILAATFFLTSLVLTYLSGHRTHGDSVMDRQAVLPTAASPTVPAVPGSAVTPGAVPNDAVPAAAPASHPAVPVTGAALPAGGKP